MFSAPSASPVVLLKLRNRPFTVTRYWVGPTAPIESGGTNPGVSAIVAPVKFVPRVCGVESVVNADGAPPGSWDTLGERGSCGSDLRKSASCSGLGTVGVRPDRSTIRCSRIRVATDLVRLGAPVTGVPPCQVVSVADPGADAARRIPASERRASPTSRDAIPATALRVWLEPRGSDITPPSRAEA